MLKTRKEELVEDKNGNKDQRQQIYSSINNIIITGNVNDLNAPSKR